MLPATFIKRQIDFNKQFRSLLDVMKLVAVSQYHILEKKLQYFDLFGEVLTEFFDSIDVSRVNHPFLNGGDKPVGVLAITSDGGLLGGMNMQVIAKAVDILSRQPGKLIIVGERGQIYAQGFGMSFTYFTGIIDNERYAQAMTVRDYVTQEILNGNLGGLKVVFPRALSLVMNKIEVETLVPFTRKDAEGAAPKTGGSLAQVILETRPEDIAEYLVYLYVGERLYEVFGMARLAEQAARFVHLEESCQKIQDMNNKLLLQYFKRRHEIIDSNMRELFSAKKAYADG